MSSKSKRKCNDSETRKSWEEARVAEWWNTSPKWGDMEVIEAIFVALASIMDGA